MQFGFYFDEKNIKEFDFRIFLNSLHISYSYSLSHDALKLPKT